VKPLLFRLRGFPKTEAALREKVLHELEKARVADPDLESSWKSFRRKRPSGMKRANYLKLRVLHRQFEGARPTGLPTLVRAARFFVKRLGKWKRRAR